MANPADKRKLARFFLVTEVDSQTSGVEGASVEGVMNNEYFQTNIELLIGIRAPYMSIPSILFI
jgi:hypothetical protein